MKEINCNFDVRIALNIWKNIYRIRSVEERIAKKYPEGKMRCPTHLSIGQEGVPGAWAECIRINDFAVSTHRGHAHYLAKGGSLNAMLGELYGKVTGCCRGRGGSMHLVDTSVGFMGTTAIVGNSIPLGVGLALSDQLKETDHISCVFLGDGAIEEGAFYESVNFAVVRKLPVLFICENNLYSVYSPLSVRQPKDRNISAMVKAMGIQTDSGDGNDPMAAFEIMTKSVKRVRSGEGPFFLEFSTYRWREHCGHSYDNHLNYRSEQEFEEWRLKDPLLRLEKQLFDKDITLEAILAQKRMLIEHEIDLAFQFAEESPYPEASEAYTKVYADE